MVFVRSYYLRLCVVTISYHITSCLSIFTYVSTKSQKHHKICRYYIHLHVGSCRKATKWRSISRCPLSASSSLVNATISISAKLREQSKPQPRDIKAKWSNLTKKGLETSESDNPRANVKSAIISSLTRKPTGSKFADVIVSAMKNKDVLKLNTDPETASAKLKKLSQAKKNK